MRRITSFLRRAEIEYRKFKRTGDLTSFAQAGEKLWNAFGMLVEKVSRRKIESFGELRDAVYELSKKDKLFLRVFEDTYDLHKFFYRGWTEDISIEQNQFLTSLHLIKLLKRKYGV